MSLPLLVAAMMIVVGVLVIGSLLLLREQTDKPTKHSFDESVPSHRNCYDLCKDDSEGTFEGCMALCEYGWP